MIAARPVLRLVDAELLEAVAADPDWAARVIVAAGSALNSLLAPPELSSIVRPGAEHFAAKEILQHAFIAWPEVLSQLQVDDILGEEDSAIIEG